MITSASSIYGLTTTQTIDMGYEISRPKMPGEKVVRAGDKI